jgi:hypothetical protein
MNFKIETVKMGELRKAEASNSAAMELLASHAVTAAGESVPFDQAMAELDTMDMLQFYEAWAEFQKVALPNLSGRRS